MENVKTNKAEKTVTKMIEWGNKKEVVNQWSTVAELKKAKLIEKIAKTFGYGGVEEQYARLEKNNYFKFYEVKADPKFNYGMDFELWAFYTADEGMLFMRKIEFGGSITSRPLSRVHFNTVEPAIITELMTMISNKKSNEDLELWQQANKAELKKGFEQMAENRKNYQLESFEFSMNIGYKKDMEYRAELREYSKDRKWVYCSL